ncbi:uncharacterized protein LOC131625918 [Vicia villosa]|uniref:uncharacterized protein LOC131625918 n=1 Tax=Vicia villosa TaxID=3911 RepID=UPI00273C1DB2|nr:uncharacterized protein LOC131625918 [Vicia villosa]
MDYVAPKIVDGKVEVEIEDADVESELQFWDSALILYVLGGDISMNMLKQYMTQMWKFVQLPDMVYHDEGYFILKCRSHSDKEAVMMKEPYTLQNIPLLLREWKPWFRLKNDILRTLPIWVKLPQLPLYLWGVRILNKIGSALGNPLVIDECTDSKLHVSYSHILVEVDVMQELKKTINIRDVEGRKLQQPIEYEWKPLFCEKFEKFGYTCKENTIKQWKLKAPGLVEKDKTP